MTNDHPIDADNELQSSGPAHGNASVEQEAHSVPDWITNDGLLRDEGALFGMAQATQDQVENKVQVIRDVYEGLIAKAKHQEERLNERASHLKDKQAAIERKKEAIRANIDAPDVPEVEGSEDHTPHTFMRHVTGFLVTVVACIGTFFLIYEQFQNEFDYALWISLGVTLAGLFSVFSPVSLLFTSTRAQTQPPDAPERWKVYLVELAVPIAVSTFVVLWRVEAHLWPRLVGLWLMLTISFLVVGRLLLSTVPQMALLFKVLKRQVKVAWMRRKHRKELQALRNTEQKRLEEEQDALQDAWEQLDSTRPLEKLCERKVRLFISEYDLARRWSATQGEPRIRPEIISEDA
ncbi:MAG: hypothetical protein R6U20_03650 [Longimonas sp.]|uniref:hypothetical protein n=1 Tax=Longimonas sp. TaxID=2039626 RepID=UPI003976752D